MEFDKDTMAQLEGSFKGIVDQVMEEKLAKAIDPLVAAQVKAVVEKMRIERTLTGKDYLNEEQKKAFVTQCKEIANGEYRVKANEGLIEQQDNRGGYLVAPEVANAIVRIAASVGVAMSQCMKWPMKSDELDIPAYRGSFLSGEYLGVDAAGSVTALTFSQAKLVVKRWQLAFVVGNDLLADASVDLADWLLALGGEALANQIDTQAFTGTGLPFVGLTASADVTVYNLGGSTTSGETTFASFTLDDASDMIASVEESMLDGAAFYFSRTVWSKIRMKKDTAGNYVVTQPNGAELLEIMTKNGGIRPAGMLLGFPVYTIRSLPANSATAVSTKFCIFGNLQAFAYGDKGDLRVAQFNSGSFGGKEIALADQTALVYKHRHALVLTLPAAFVVGKTSAS